MVSSALICAFLASGSFAQTVDIEFGAIQIDYNPIYFDNDFRNNAKFSIGIVFH